LFFYVFEKVKKLDKNKKYPEKITDQSEVTGCNVLQIVVCHCVPFLLVIVLSVLLRYTYSNYHFGILKLFLTTSGTRRITIVINSETSHA
jgi:hypothetical protein